MRVVSDRFGGLSWARGYLPGKGRPGKRCVDVADATTEEVLGWVYDAIAQQPVPVTGLVVYREDGSGMLPVVAFRPGDGRLLVADRDGRVKPLQGEGPFRFLAGERALR